MPASTRRSCSRRDSWPPTRVRLQSPVEDEVAAAMGDDLDLSMIDEDPLTYFLTPAPLLQVDDDDYDEEDPAMMDFDFDAGIEDSKHPPMIVRSVSPSSLEGLSLPPARPPTPPRSPPSRLSPDPESATDEDDDDSEDYVRFGTGRLHNVGLPLSLRDFAAGAMTKGKGKGKAVAAAAAADPHLSPASFAGATTLSSSPSSSLRGRPTARFGPGPSPGGGGMGTRTRSLSARRRSPHAWREPSPDVWSIEEETEEELHSEVGSSVAAEDAAAAAAAMAMLASSAPTKGSGAMDIPAAAKPKKRVRFVLPVTEIHSV